MLTLGWRYHKQMSTDPSRADRNDFLCVITLFMVSVCVHFRICGLIIWPQFQTIFFLAAWWQPSAFWLPTSTEYNACVLKISHYNDVIMSVMASQFTSLTVVYSIVYSRRKSKKTSKLRVIGLWAGNSQVTGEFPAQRASNAENATIWWRHHVQTSQYLYTL